MGPVAPFSDAGPNFDNTLVFGGKSWSRSMSEHAPNVRIDDLLAHAGWVRGLALSLVRDPGAADDLVQETWLAAMRRKEIELGILG